MTGPTFLIIIIVIVVLVSIYAFVYLIFNRQEAKSNIQLSKMLNAINYKNDLLPGILQTLKNHLPERENFIFDLSQKRSESYEARTDLPRKQIAEKELEAKVDELFDIAKNHEQFKEDPTFVELRHKYSNTETSINLEVEKYNSLVKKFNKLRKYLVIFTAVLRIKPLQANK